MQLLQNNVPREIRQMTGHNLVIFTDACYERNDLDWRCGIGGVACFGSNVQFFSVAVKKEGREILGESVKKQIIFEAETSAALVAYVLWKNEISNKRCLLFVDN